MRFSLPESDRADGDDNGGEPAPAALVEPEPPARASGGPRDDNAENYEYATARVEPPEPPARLPPQKIVISASGVDAAVRDALKAVATHVASRGGVKARLVDNDLMSKLRGATPPKATHLIVAPRDDDRGARTLKVLFALARGGTAIVTPQWVFDSQTQGAWLDAAPFLAGYGPPRATGRDLLAGKLIHALESSFTSTDPARTALVALISAAGGKSVAQRQASLVIVGESWTMDKPSAGLKALAKKGCVVRVRWLFDAIEADNSDFATRPYRVTPE